jgi:hypothetical protein
VSMCNRNHINIYCFSFQLEELYSFYLFATLSCVLYSENLTFIRFQVCADFSFSKIETVTSSKDET